VPIYYLLDQSFLATYTTSRYQPLLQSICGICRAEAYLSMRAPSVLPPLPLTLAAWGSHLVVHHRGPSSLYIPRSLLFHPGNWLWLSKAPNLPPSAHCTISVCWTWNETLHALRRAFFFWYQWLLSPPSVRLLYQQGIWWLVGHMCWLGLLTLWFFRTSFLLFGGSWLWLTSLLPLYGHLKVYVAFLNICSVAFW